jgi:hypothetical protein
MSRHFSNRYGDAVSVESSLVLVNPYRWLSFYAGNSFKSTSPLVGDKVIQPLNNLLVTKEYLEIAQ